ncbi:MAG: hypothetical protein WAR36_00150 [Candidatus Methanoculleus thermohydrogenotrophicum]
MQSIRRALAEERLTEDDAALIRENPRVPVVLPTGSRRSSWRCLRATTRSG